MLALLLALVSFAIFSLLYLAPGNAVEILLGTKPRTPEMVRLLRHEYHLDKPFFTQYWIWARGAAQLHFGNSIQTTLPVSEEIDARLPTSLFLGVYAYLLTMVVGVGLGTLAAFRGRGIVDRSVVAGAIVALSTPAFVGGVFLLYLFGVLVPWFPTYGKGAGFFDELWHLTLPAIALAGITTGTIVKHTRAAMIGVLDQDYLTFARARGLSAPRILLVYALRNALIPIVTVSAILLSGLIVGAVFIENTFSLPGIGQLLVQSANAEDLPMIQGVAMMMAVVIMGANLHADLLYMAVDPRIRLGRGSA